MADLHLPFKFEGRFICPVCSKGFTKLHDKKDHMKSIHPKTGD